MAVRFAIEGDLRFISHHDTMRLFERALARAQLPIRFSEGFNPRPRLSLPVPRAVGTASEADVLVIELGEPVEPSAVLDRLNRQTPADLTLLEAWVLETGRVPQVDMVEYAVALPAGKAGAVARSIDRLMATETYPVERTGAGKTPGKTIDLRAYLAEAAIEDNTLRWTVMVTPGGSARPAELLAAVGLSPEDWLHRVRRTAIHWVAAAGHGEADESRPPGS